MVSWDIGNYEIEWIPPTDEERKMFVAASNGESLSFDDWYCCESGLYGSFSSYEIAESLALDGADYDNMPEGFE